MVAASCHNQHPFIGLIRLNCSYALYLLVVPVLVSDPRRTD